MPDLLPRWYAYRDTRAQLRAIDWLLDAGHVDENDATTQQTLHHDTCLQILQTLTGTPETQIEAADLPRQWDEISATINAGRSINITHNGQPWAIPTPAPQA